MHLSTCLETLTDQELNDYVIVELKNKKTKGYSTVITAVDGLNPGGKDGDPRLSAQRRHRKELPCALSRHVFETAQAL